MQNGIPWEIRGNTAGFSGGICLIENSWKSRAQEPGHRRQDTNEKNKIRSKAGAGLPYQ